MDHDDLAHSLACHLMSDDIMVWEDIPAGKSGSCRPDVFTIRKSFSQPNPTSYEVKVSVSDFRSDVTSGKYQKYLDFSSSVVFATPKGMIKKSEIPIGCGLIQWNGSGWNTLKRPTINPSFDISSEFLLKLLIEGKERQTTSHKQKTKSYDAIKHNKTLMKKFGRDIAKKHSLIRDYPKMKSDLYRMKKELADLFGLNPDKEWGLEFDIQYHIDNLKKESCSDAMKNSFSDDISRLEISLSREISIIKNNLDINQNI